MTTQSVHCGKCGAAVPDTPSGEERKPCPHCGSTIRRFDVSITACVKFHDSLKFRHKRSGKTLAEGISGDELHEKSGRWMKKERLIDREKDRYKEVVTDPETGGVVHRCEEPLSKHTGHGSAKPAEAVRCVHCRKPLKKKTKDHVFPKSWYPENTPENVQRWTVPSCADCNGKFGQLEKELFIRAAMCVGPVKAEAAGLSKKAVQSLGVGVSGLPAKEKRYRQALKAKILKEMEPYNPGTECFPGLGPHPGFPESQQFQIPIAEVLIKQVAEKIVRGCEYVLDRKRIIEPPYNLAVYFAYEHKIADVLKLFAAFGPVYLGPGFRVTRAAAHDDPKTVMYKIDIWGTWSIYASILPEVEVVKH